LKLPLKEPGLVTARVEGKMGVVRELSSIINFNSPYCTILSMDAVDMGYPEAGNKHPDEERLHPKTVPRFTELRGIERGILVKLQKVSVGSLVARNVEAVVLELEIPRFITFDFMLGRSFLKNFKLTVDVKKQYISLV
jgi:hypothetical protein